MKTCHSWMKPGRLHRKNGTFYNTKKRYNYKRYKRNEERIVQLFERDNILNENIQILIITLKFP